MTVNMLTNISLLETYNLFETKVNLGPEALTIDECTYAELLEHSMCAAEGVLDSEWLGRFGDGMYGAKLA